VRERASFTQRTQVVRAGRFATGALDQAGRRGWTVVDMKTDWNGMFPAAAVR
jgi:hypothetical protein